MTCFIGIKNQSKWWIPTKVGVSSPIHHWWWGIWSMLTWFSVVWPGMPLPLPSSISSRASFPSCKNFGTFCMRECSAARVTSKLDHCAVLVSHARFQCCGNSESVFFSVCVCVCVCCARTSPHLPQVQDRTSAANQAVTRESLWSEVLLPFGAFVGGGGLRKAKKRKPTQMMWSYREKMTGKPNLFHLLSFQRAIYEITQKQASQQSGLAETEVNGQELCILPCSWNDLHFTTNPAWVDLFASVGHKPFFVVTNYNDPVSSGINLQLLAISFALLGALKQLQRVAFIW